MNKNRIIKILTVLFALCMLAATITACSNVSIKLKFIVDGSVYQQIDTSGNETIDIPDNPKKEGFIFDGWYWDNNTWQKPFTANSLLEAPIQSDMCVYAKFRLESAEMTSYSTEYYLQNIENDEYTLFETTNKEGEKGSTINAEIKTFEHFTPVNNVVEGQINADGTTVLKVYYNRNKYTVTFNGNGGNLVTGTEVQTIKYQGTAIAPIYVRNSYDFVGFDKDFTNVIENIVVSAQWADKVKLNYDMNGVTFANKTVTYNGQSHSICATGLPEGVSVTYENNGQTDAGTYEIIAKFTGDTVNYNEIPNKTATLKINKANYDMSGVIFNDTSYDYDGEVHSIIAYRVPQGVTVEYIGNNQKNVGVYTVIAYFTGDSKNYNAIEEMTATLTIRENFREKYQQFEMLGKAMNLTTAIKYEIDSGTKSIFSDDIFYTKVNDFVKGEWEAEVGSSTSYKELIDSTSRKVSSKVNGGISFSPLFSLGFNFEVKGSYEKKSKEQTNTYFYNFKQKVSGHVVEIDGYKEKEKFSSMLSQEFIQDADKVRSGKLSAEDFVAKWGTHVVMAAVKGALLEAMYSEISHNNFDSTKIEEELTLGINARIDKVETGAEFGENLEKYTTTQTEDKITDFAIKGVGGQPLGGTSLESFYANYPAWANSLNENNYVWIDVPEGSLFCVWDFLDESYNDVKDILNQYVNKVCQNQYKIALDKINSIYKDDVVYDEDTKTMTINLKNYQNNGSSDGFEYVNFENGIMYITPYYQSNLIEKIVINGLYKQPNLTDGIVINSLVENFAIKLSDSWTKDITIELNNVGIEAPMDAVCIDASLVESNVTIIANGECYIKGGDGTDGIELGESGCDGAVGILANELNVLGVGKLTIVGGKGGDGHKGGDGTQGSTGADGLNQVRGSTGGVGSKGKNGGKGASGATSIKAKTITILNGNIILQGGAGGIGGAGGTGGKGGTGGIGYAGVIGSAGAGNGGAGGIGGKGGLGGNGGLVVQCEVLNIINGELTLQGGNAGNGGAGGTGGKGGTGGNATQWGAYCGSAGGGGSGGFGGEGGNGGSVNKIESIVTVSASVDASVIINEGSVGAGGVGGYGGAVGKPGTSALERPHFDNETDNSNKKAIDGISGEIIG